MTTIYLLAPLPLRDHARTHAARGTLPRRLTRPPTAAPSLPRLPPPPPLAIGDREREETCCPCSGQRRGCLLPGWDGETRGGDGRQNGMVVVGRRFSLSSLSTHHHVLAARPPREGKEDRGWMLLWMFSFRREGRGREREGGTCAKGRSFFALSLSLSLSLVLHSTLYTPPPFSPFLFFSLRRAREALSREDGRTDGRTGVRGKPERESGGRQRGWLYAQPPFSSPGLGFRSHAQREGGWRRENEG